MKLLRAAARAALVCAILGFAPGLIDPFHAAKAFALQALGLGLLAVVAADALERRAAAERPPALVRALDASVIGWCVACTIAAAFGLSPRLAVFGELEQREGLVTQLALAGLYAGVRRSHTSAAHVRGTLDVLLAAGALAAVYALAQFARVDPVPWSSALTYAAGGEAARRAFGTLGNPILLGAVVAAALAAGVARLARDGGAWRIVAVAACSAALPTTLSRGSVAAGAAGVALALALSWRPPARAARRLVAAAAALLPAAVVALAALRGTWLARLTEDVGSSALSSGARAELARSAVALWRKHPWTGVGPDAFGLAFPPVQTPAFWSAEWLGLPVHAHAVPLQTLATLGALGALAGAAWLGFAVLVWTGVWRRARVPGDERPAVAAAIGAALFALVAAGTINVVGLAGAAVFAVLTALTGALGAGTARSAHDRALSVRALVAGGVVALACAWASVAPWSAFAEAGAARSALEQSVETSGEARRALAAWAAPRAETAAARSPGDDELWRLASDVEASVSALAYASGDIASADGAARRAEAAALSATALEPRRASNTLRLASALAARARVAKLGGAAGADSAAALAARAFAAFDRAAALAPADALVRVAQCRAALELARPDVAAVAAAAIVADYPGAAMGHTLAAAAALARGDHDSARAALRVALASRWEPDAGPQRRAAEEMLARLDAERGAERGPH